jgi:tellurium resistance protein TerD
MAHNLNKNEKYNLTKNSDQLSKVHAVLSWVTPDNVFPKYDLDVSGFMLGSDAKLIDEDGFIYYNNQSSPDNSVWMGEDERSGGSEDLFIDVKKLPESISEISVLVTIHKAIQRKQSFDKVKDAKIEIFNEETGDLLATFKLDTVKKGSTSVHVGSFFKQEDEFVFHAIEESYELTLQDFIDGYTH